MSVSFDRIADRYDATRGFPSGVGEQVGAALAHEAALTPGARMLEIGVGTGRLALPVVSYLPGLAYVGVDISREMMATLRGKAGAEAIHLAQADATQLPFADGSFDAALAVHVFHLVSDAEQALAELWRVLRPRGLFLHGYNDFDGDERLNQLRQGRWRAFVEERGVALRHHRNGPTLAEQISPIFGEPRTVTLTTWEQQMVPRKILDGLCSRSSSATWDIPEPLFSAAVADTEAWAQEEFDDLDQPIVGTGSFKLEVYER